MQFKLYDVAGGGTPIATYPPSGTVAVSVQDGMFTALLDFGLTPFGGERRWIEVVVAGNTLIPRQELTAAPYALYALNGPGGGSYWQAGTNGIYYNAGNVGIGADASPDHLLEVAGDDVLISTIGGGQANLILNDTDGGATPPGIVFWNNAESAFYADDLTDEIFAFRAGYPSPRTHDAHLRVYGHEDSQFVDLTHDGDDAILSSTSGDLVLYGTGSQPAMVVLNSLTTGDIRFYTGGVLPPSAERVIIDAIGNVGIGISTPNARLNAYSVGGTAVMGQSGTGTGVYGVSGSDAGVLGYNINNGAIGRLGYQQYGVYGEKPDGFAGYFDGDVHVTGDLTVDGSLDVNAWSLTGNVGTVPGTNFLGTTDNQPLVLKANGLQVMRLEPTATSPNVISGFAENQALSGVVGATIGGGGRPDDGVGDPEYNWVRAHFGTIAGGAANRVGSSGGPEDGQYGTVGGGDFNNASGEYSVIAGGHSNWAGGGYASIPGGINNQAAGDYSLAAGRRAIVRSPVQVGGGDTDGDEGTFVWADSTDADFTSTGPNQFLVRATGGVNFVADADPNAGGGLRVLPVAAADSYGNRTPNLVNGYTGNNVTSGVVGATIAGGGAAIIAGLPSQNAVTDIYGTVGGGARNVAGNNTGTTADARYATVGGGLGNSASGDRSTIAGGLGNSASGYASTVGGGYYNAATGYASTVGGGYYNAATGYDSTVGGGYYNAATGYASTVGGGYFNDADGFHSTVGGGYGNNPTGDNSTVGGGYVNTASGTESTVPGGSYNQAGGQFSFAAGRRAKVRDPNQVGGGDTNGDEGAFIWADSTDADFTSTGPNQFLIRASGGMGINTNSPSNDLTVDGDADFTGNVGVGTDSPAYKLDVNGVLRAGSTGSTAANLIIDDTNGGNDRPGLQFTNNSQHYVAGDDGSAEAFGFYSVFGNTRNYAASLTVHGPATGSWGKYIGMTHDGTDGKVYTDAGDILLNPATGNVGIGVSDPSEKLDTSGTARLRGIGTSTGTTVVADANGKLWKQSSSQRYKHNVADLPTAGDAVLDLRPVSFDWNSTGAPDIGLIAEEVEQVLPDLVIRDADGQPDGVRYDKVALYLLDVLREQRSWIATQAAQLAGQQERIAAQAEEVSNLKARLAKIEALLAEHEAQPTGGVR